MPGNLPTSYADPFGPLPLSRLGSQLGQVRAGSPTNLRLRRLSFRPISGFSQTNSGQVEESISETQPSPGTGMLYSQAAHVFNRPSDSNRKTSSIGATAYEAHSVAPKKALACPRISGKGHSNSPISPCTSKVVVGPGQGALRSTLTPSSARPSTVYRRLKRRLGRSLRRLHGKRSLVRVRKCLAHKFVRAQGSPAGLKTVRVVMLQPDSSCLYRQHHCGLLHQQGRGYEIRLTLCPPLETDALVQSKADCPEGQAYSGSPERHSRQAVPTQSGDPNGMVPPPGGVCSNMPALAPSVCGPVCHPVQSQTSPVCIPGFRPISVGSGCLKSPLGGPGRLCLSTDDPSSSGGNETFGPRIPSSHSDSTRLAQHALVLGPGQHVNSNSPPAPSGVEFDNSAVQSVSSPGPSQSEPSCLAPRASAIQQAGFSAEVATRIEAPQRRSTRAIYESKWSVFVRWCEKNQVDFRTPSIEQIADFLLSLFQEKHLQPSTIEGYRTAIADKVGNSRINISKDENLSRLLDSFHRDKPKGRRGVPTWNLSLVLHQLTQPPFEPLRKASLKYLTFKTVFLLALGSGNGGVKFMRGFTGTLGTKRIGRMFPYRPLLVSSLRTTWLKRVPPAWPLLSFQPWPLHWTDPSRRIGVCARSGHYVITWTKPKISVLAKNWFLFPLGRVSRRILSLLPFPPGSNKPSSFVTRCQINRLNYCIRLGLMTFARSPRPKPFKGVFP